MAATAVISAGSAIAAHSAQNSAERRNRRASNSAAQQDLNALDVRDIQERTAAIGDILSIERQVQQARGTAAVAAGEAGVSGASVQALLAIIETRGGEAVGDINTSLRMTREQIGREGQAIRTLRESRISSVQPGSKIELGARVAAAGLDAYTGYRNSLPTPGGNS